MIRLVVKPKHIDTERFVKMKTTTLFAIILIVIGIMAFGYQGYRGITFTTREKVVDLGALQITAEKTKTIPLPPIVGAIALLSGVALIGIGGKKNG